MGREELELEKIVREKGEGELGLRINCPKGKRELDLKQFVQKNGEEKIK